MSPRRPSLFLALLSVVLVFSPGTSARADSIVLKDGRELRAIDVEKKDGHVLATLETARRVAIPEKLVVAVRQGGADDKVEYRGKTVSLREKIVAVRRERVAEEKERLRVIEIWARGKKGHEEAAKAFKSWSARDRERTLGRCLLESRDVAAKRLATRELVAFESSYTAQCLVHAAVTDRDEDVRKESYRSLRLIDHDRTSDFVLPYLVSDRTAHRVRASKTVRNFPSDRAVSVVLGVVSKIWTDFGRASLLQGTQRSYIGDYELVSGGTGFSLVEVADPVVRTATTGIVFDVDVTKVEARTHFATLVRLTGEDHGTDLAAWRRWWRQELARRQSESEEDDPSS